MVVMDNFSDLGDSRFFLCLGPQAAETLSGGRGETRLREGWPQPAGALSRGTGGGTAGRRNFGRVELRSCGPSGVRHPPPGPEGADASWDLGSHRALQFELGGRKADAERGIAISPVAGEWRSFLPVEPIGGRFPRGKRTFRA